MWTPGPADAGRTNSFTIRMTDNGSPALGDATTFAVVVIPPEGLQLAATLLANGLFQLAVIGDIGRTYLIEVSTNLRDWEPLSNFVSTAESTQFLDAAPASSRQRFYRVVSP